MLQRLRTQITDAGQYPPLIVRSLKRSRRFAKHKNKYQLIDGHQRLTVLKDLGCKLVVVQNFGSLTDQQTDILLLTFKRLSGTAQAPKRAKLLKRILDEQQLTLKQMTELLPDSQRTLERLIALGQPTSRKLPKPPNPADQPIPFAVYLDQHQHKLLKQALKKAQIHLPAKSPHNTAAMLETIAKDFLA